MPFNLSMTEIAVVLILALVFLGPKKLPELASGLGKMIREIKKVTAGVKEEIQLDDNVRKPFEELREALTLPAEELKRRDEWKAEWERRQAEEAAQTEQATIEGAQAADGTAGTPAEAVPGDTAGAVGTSTIAADVAPTDAPADASKSNSSVAFARTTFVGVGGASTPGTEATIAAAPVSGGGDKTIISPSPAATLAPVTATSAPPTAADASAPAFKLPTAPPPGAVPAGAGARTTLGMGAATAAQPAPTRPRPTPPPPPPAARLPAPNVARSVPKPESIPAPALPDDPSDSNKA